MKGCLNLYVVCIACSSYCNGICSYISLFDFLQETRMNYPFGKNTLFSSRDLEDKFSLLAIMCKCTIKYDSSDAVGQHCYSCPFMYDYESNTLRATDS